MDSKFCNLCQNDFIPFKFYHSRCRDCYFNSDNICIHCNTRFVSSENSAVYCLVCYKELNLKNINKISKREHKHAELCNMAERGHGFPTMNASGTTSCHWCKKMFFKTTKSELCHDCFVFRDEFHGGHMISPDIHGNMSLKTVYYLIKSKNVSKMTRYFSVPRNLFNKDDFHDSGYLKNQELKKYVELDPTMSDGITTYYIVKKIKLTMTPLRNFLFQRS